MRDVAIVTDSTADLPEGVAGSRGIEVVPLTVEIGGEVFLDGELTQEEFFARMDAAEQLPKTAQPTPEDFTEHYRRILGRAKEIVSLHLPDTVSGTIESARRAAEGFGDRVHVVDAHTWSSPMGLMAMKAQEWADSGMAAAQVAERLTRIRDRSRILIALDGLENLAKGGRIGNAAALFGGILDVRVLLTIRDSVIEPVKKVRGSRKALDAGLDWFAEQVGDQADGVFCVMHAFAGDKPQRAREFIEERWPGREVLMAKVGVVVSAHTGRGWGAAFVPHGPA